MKQTYQKKLPVFGRSLRIQSKYVHGLVLCNCLLLVFVLCGR